MAAEFFDDKLLSFGYTTFGVYETRNLTYDEFVYYELMVNLAQFDATIAIWKEKARWDAVRPFTAIPYLYGDQKLTAYCGKGRERGIAKTKIEDVSKKTQLHSAVECSNRLVHLELFNKKNHTQHMFVRSNTIFFVSLFNRLWKQDLALCNSQRKAKINHCSVHVKRDT